MPNWTNSRPGSRASCSRNTRSNALAKAIKLNCLQNGLVIETGGRNGAVLRFLPPLIVSEADIHEILNRFEQAVETACRA
ncbi:aminotransferase class III-fold pyridoxal phosphate-dependent enzyme [Burkholderia ubonensis]|uniref:aminotransferase class III-fold pyridoxal phosphate-dependent enzyme n=1 Tax=Burkholderia ubonensis TaxID=101571 RepID=UPI00076CF950|nr:aminotransferase class III-fold pyridoxal phosphate-dependent enzyme [Burkholderia ubonensis]KVU07437.1 hypothetical protein WK62_09165 [Burkholderia ubonensis]